MQKSLLSQQINNSPLKQQARLAGGPSSKKKKGLFFALNLTTLIDAFCILVIFLLSNMNSQLKQIQMKESQALPFATKSELLKEGIVVRVENEDVYIDEVKTNPDELLQKLMTLKKENKENKDNLIIQADKNSDYDKISLLLKAGGQAGFEKYLFAVIPGR